MEQLAKALREEMARRNHSYRDAAKEIGVSAGTIMNWSKGWIVHQPRLEHLDPLAGYLGVASFIILGWIGRLSDAQVELLSTIPGLLITQEALALIWVEQQGYLNSAAASVLVAS